MEKVLHIVHLHVLYRNYYTGVDRYLEMFREGIRSRNEYDQIRMHRIYCTDDKSVLFPKIKRAKNGEISAIIPLPQGQKLIFKDAFWKTRYMKVISEILTPFFSEKKNLIFQYHNLFLSDLAKELKSTFGGKMITHLHCLPWKYNYEKDTAQFNRLYHLYDNKAYNEFKKEEKSEIRYNLSDFVICLSRVAKEYLTHVHQVAEDKIEIVHNGLNLRSSVPQRREATTAEILYVGKVSKDKGIFELLEALRIVKERGYEFRFRIAGCCPGALRSEIHTEYKDLDIDYLGQVSFDKLKELYSTASFGVIPSLHEQCSYVALEMSLFGLPIIVSNVDALAEMFRHEVTALLTPLVFDADFGIKADTAKFADNIIRMMVDEKLRNRLSTNAYKHYQASFTLEKMIDQTLNIYNRLV